MRIGYFILFVLLLAGCAKVVSPSGGPKDETPPVIVSSSPENKSVNINNNEITIVFDEYIKPFQANQIIISPYQEEMPELQFIGKSLVIKLQEELEPNTTYSIDFNGAIKDYRQDNVIETLDYAFSSGAVLDTAQFSGQLIEAESGEPFVSETIRVMAYPVGDSLFYKEPPRYLAKVDTTGSFVLKNLVAGEYNLYALDDLNFNNYFDQIGEAIAFLDAPIQTVDSTASEQTLFVHLSKDSINRIENNNKLKEGQGSIVFTQKYQEISLEDESGLYIERAAKSDTLSIWYTNAQAKTQAVFGNGTFIDSLYLREYDDSLEVHQRFRFNSTQFKKEEEPLRLKFRFRFM